MSDTFGLEVNGLTDLTHALERLGRETEKELKPTVEAALHYLWQELPPYPPPPGADAPSPLVTAKQRRWFFAALREGSVKVPYKRRMSGGIGGSLSTEVRSLAGEIRGLMGSNTPYAHWVIGKTKQAPIHQGRWWVFEDEIPKNLPGALEIIEAGVTRLLKTL